MQRVRMLRNQRGSPNGIRLVVYERGWEGEVTDLLAKAFCDDMDPPAAERRDPTFDADPGALGTQAATEDEDEDERKSAGPAPEDKMVHQATEDKAPPRKRARPRTRRRG